MVNKILEQFRTDVEAIPWIDKYGGLAKTIEVDGEVDGKQYVIHYPVSCGNANESCISSGNYTELLPNTNYKSVVYFIQETPFQRIGKKDRSFDVWEFKTTLRLVCWLNLPKLGYKDQFCNAVSLFVMDFWKNIESFKTSNPSAKLEVIAQLPNDEKLVFQEYLGGVIQDRMGLFTLYPYGFFGLNISLTADLAPSCWDAVPVLPENIC